MSRVSVHECCPYIAVGVKVPPSLVVPGAAPTGRPKSPEEQAMPLRTADQRDKFSAMMEQENIRPDALKTTSQEIIERMLTHRYQRECIQDPYMVARASCATQAAWTRSGGAGAKIGAVVPCRSRKIGPGDIGTSSTWSSGPPTAVI